MTLKIYRNEEYARAFLGASHFLRKCRQVCCREMTVGVRWYEARRGSVDPHPYPLPAYRARTNAVRAGSRTRRGSPLHRRWGGWPRAARSGGVWPVSCSLSGSKGASGPPPIRHFCEMTFPTSWARQIALRPAQTEGSEEGRRNRSDACRTLKAATVSRRRSTAAITSAGGRRASRPSRRSCGSRPSPRRTAQAGRRRRRWTWPAPPCVRRG
jgi:hypothetical protein